MAYRIGIIEPFNAFALYYDSFSKEDVSIEYKRLEDLIELKLNKLKIK